jgi:hypothetical protein
MEVESKSGLTVPAVAHPLDREVSIRAKVTESGFEGAARSRFISACDALFGSTVGLLSAWADGCFQRLVIRQQIKTDDLKIVLRGSSATPEQTGNEPSMILQSLVNNEAKRLECRAAVLDSAVAEARALPPLPVGDEPSGDNKLDSAWIDTFSSYADKATTDDLRTLWGRILAGEIRKPRSFSLATLRIIAELDAQTAAIFQEIARFRFREDGSYIVRRPNPKGKEIDDLALLEEAGLLQGPFGSISIDYPHNSGVMDIKNRNYLLRVYIPVTEDAYQVPLTHDYKIPAIKLTRAGHEIANILPWDEIGCFEAMTEIFTEGCGLEIYSMHEPVAGGIRIELLRSIRPTTWQQSLRQ